MEAFSMVTFLWIVGGVVILTVALNTVKFLISIIFKTAIGSIVGLSAVLYGIFLLVR